MSIIDWRDDDAVERWMERVSKASPPPVKIQVTTFHGGVARTEVRAMKPPGSMPLTAKQEVRSRMSWCYACGSTRREYRSSARFGRPCESPWHDGRW